MNNTMINKMDLNNLIGYVYTLLDFINIEDFEDEENVSLVKNGFNKFVQPMINMLNNAEQKTYFSNDVWDVQDYVEEVTGDRPCYTSLDEMGKDFYEKDICLWNYPICEVEHIIENRLKVCLVRFQEMSGGYEYRWCELKD